MIRSTKQRYFTGGNNDAATYATGDILFFLNNDTIVDQHCISHLVKEITNKPYRLVQPKILWKNNKQRIDNVGGRYSWLGYGHAVGRDEIDRGQYDQPAEYDYVNGTAIMMHKKFFLSLRGFDETFHYFYEDVDVCLRARNNGGSCFSVPNAVVYHEGSKTFKNIGIQPFIRRTIRENRIKTMVKNEPSNIQLTIKYPLLQLSHLLLSLTDTFIHNHSTIIPTLINKHRIGELKSHMYQWPFSLLDVGCGSGRYVQLAQDSGINATGIDKIPQHTPYTKQVSVEKFSSEKKYDVITLYHVIEHITSPEEMLRKIKTILEPDGLLVIEVPLVGNLTERFLQRNYFAYYDKTHKHFFSKHDVLELCNSSGFYVIGRGFTLYAFPLTVITTGFRIGFLKGITGIMIFLPLKILTMVGYNEEIVRFYVRPTSRKM